LNNNYFKDLSKNRKNEILPKEVMREINRYIHEPKLDRLNMQNFEFIKEMKRLQNFRMTILMGVETIGLEEVFLKIPYFMKGVVVKDIVCYELEVTDINLMLKDITKEQNETISLLKDKTKEQNKKINLQNETINLLKDKTNRLNGMLKESEKIINLLENSLEQSKEIINLLENSLKDSNETIDDLREQVYFWVKLNKEARQSEAV
jgi:hypothetical protein